MFKDPSNFCEGERIPLSEPGSREIKEEATAMVQAKARGGWAGKEAPGKVTSGQIGTFLKRETSGLADGSD